MTARKLIPLALALAVTPLGIAACGGSSSDGASTDEQPNVILIVTDDQSMGQFSPEAMPRTYELVARQGTTFPRFWVNTAQCCPSRATMLTGQYAHNNGVLSNRDGYPAMRDPENVLPVWLKEAGYNTSHVGKFLQGYQRSVADLSVAPGWERWRMQEGPTYYDYILVDEDGTRKSFGGSSRDYSTSVLNRIAAREVSRLGAREAPFFLQFDHRAPHTESGLDSGGRCGGLALPAPGDEDLFEGTRVPRPPSFNERDVSDKPVFIRQAPRLDRRDIRSLNKRWPCALATLREVDRGVAEIVSELRRLGELDETVLAFVSDHGTFFGEHRILKGKVLPYTPASATPFAIRVPGAYLDGPRAGRVGAAVGNVDIAPTILELAGAEPCVEEGECRVMDGRSLIPLIDGSPDWPANRTMVLEYTAETTKRYAICEFTGIWSGRETLRRYTSIAGPGGRCEDTDILERYDLSADPYELQNLCAAGCPDDGAQAALEARLEELASCAGIEGRDPEPASGHYCE